MAFYELVFIIRQDISSAGVDSTVDEVIKIAQDNGGTLVKKEYWGLRSLAYEIDGNKKGHYVLLGLEADHAATQELDRKLKLNEDVIRVSLIKVDEISSSPSPILKVQTSNGEDVIDVTI